MFGFITRQAASVAGIPQAHVPLEPTPAAPANRGGVRQALGVTLVAIGQRVAGEMPAGQASQSEGDCA